MNLKNFFSHLRCETCSNRKQGVILAAVDIEHKVIKKLVAGCKAHIEEAFEYARILAEGTKHELFYYDPGRKKLCWSSVPPYYIAKCPYCPNRTYPKAPRAIHRGKLYHRLYWHDYLTHEAHALRQRVNAMGRATPSEAAALSAGRRTCEASMQRVELQVPDTVLSRTFSLVEFDLLEPEK